MSTPLPDCAKCGKHNAGAIFHQITDNLDGTVRQLPYCPACWKESNMHTDQKQECKS